MTKPTQEAFKQMSKRFSRFGDELREELHERGIRLVSAERGWRRGTTLWLVTIVLPNGWMTCVDVPDKDEPCGSPQRLAAYIAQAACLAQMALKIPQEQDARKEETMTKPTYTEHQQTHRTKALVELGYKPVDVLCDTCAEPLYASPLESPRGRRFVTVECPKCGFRAEMYRPDEP